MDNGQKLVLDVVREIKSELSEFRNETRKDISELRTSLTRLETVHEIRSKEEENIDNKLDKLEKAEAVIASSNLPNRVAALEKESSVKKGVMLSVGAALGTAGSAIVSWLFGKS